MSPGTRVVFLDALGTLVALEPPAPRLAAALGLVPDERVEHAMRAEMAYYREHAHEGRDDASLAELRGRCAAVVSGELGISIAVETLMDAIRFRAYDDAAPALRELRSLGIGRVCVSNWDCSLPSVLDRVGLGELLDAVVTSAISGSRKPDPAIFQAALELTGRGPDEAVHVGDTVLDDLAGAAAAGIPALLLQRDDGPDSRPEGATVIASLNEISDHLRS